MTPFVLDCSVAVSWCLGDETTEHSRSILERLLKTTGIVPSIWPLEVTNVLAVAERQGRIKAARVPQLVATLTGLPIEVHPMSRDRAFSEILSIARLHRLTAYDAAYLDLALHLALPLATMDRGLRRAAKSIGVRDAFEKAHD